jgi:hypothetical protein
MTSTAAHGTEVGVKNKLFIGNLDQRTEDV